MAIQTSFTDRFHVTHPLVLAPMAGVSGGALAAAVSDAGGLGLVGGGYGDPRWFERELRTVADSTSKPWGVGLITWAASADIVRLVLSYQPAAVFLSFGDPARFASLVRQAGARLICQVQDVAGARQAAAAGADVIVAQGTEAGGHGSSRSTLPLVPAVADAVAPGAVSDRLHGQQYVEVSLQHVELGGVAVDTEYAADEFHRACLWIDAEMVNVAAFLTSRRCQPDIVRTWT